MDTTNTETAPVEQTPAQKMAEAHNAKPATKARAAKPKPEAKHRATAIVRTADNPIKSIVPAKFKAAYADHNDTCGTKLALALKSATTIKNDEGRDTLDVSALWSIAEANGIDTKRYKDLNNGQKRMNVGNKLAGKLKAGEKVTIGKQVFANAEKALSKQPAAEQAQAAA